MSAPHLRENEKGVAADCKTMEGSRTCLCVCAQACVCASSHIFAKVSHRPQWPGVSPFVWWQGHVVSCFTVIAAKWNLNPNWLCHVFESSSTVNSPSSCASVRQQFEAWQRGADSAVCLRMLWFEPQLGVCAASNHIRDSNMLQIWLISCRKASKRATESAVTRLLFCCWSVPVLHLTPRKVASCTQRWHTQWPTTLQEACKYDCKLMGPAEFCSCAEVSSTACIGSCCHRSNVPAPPVVSFQKPVYEMANRRRVTCATRGRRCHKYSLVRRLLTACGYSVPSWGEAGLESTATCWAEKQTDDFWSALLYIYCITALSGFSDGEEHRKVLSLFQWAWFTGFFLCSLFRHYDHGGQDAAVFPFLQTLQRALQEQTVPPSCR